MASSAMPYQHLGEALGDRLLLRPRAVHRRAVGALPAHPALRRRGGAAGRSTSTGSGRSSPWPLFRRLGELGLVGDDIEGYGCPGDEPARLRAWCTWSSTAATAASARSSACRPAWRCERSTCCGSEEQKRALAAADGPRREDRRVRADRARPRLGLGGARDPRPPRRRRVGASTAPSAGSATARSPTSSSSGRATRPTARSRASWSRRARPATTRRRSTGKGSVRAIWQADIALDDVRVPVENKLPGANSVQGRRPRARRDPRRVRLGRARPRDGGLRHRAHLRAAARAVRQAAGELPDRPGPAGQDARRGHGDAAVLHAARAPRGGGPDVATRSPAWRSSTTPARRAG